MWPAEKMRRRPKRSTYIEEVRRKFYSALPNMPVPLSANNFITYGASSTPTLVLIDRGGIVRYYHPGRRWPKPNSRCEDSRSALNLRQFGSSGCSTSVRTPNARVLFQGFDQTIDCRTSRVQVLQLFPARLRRGGGTLESFFADIVQMYQKA